MPNMCGWTFGGRAICRSVCREEDASHTVDFLAPARFSYMFNFTGRPPFKKSANLLIGNQ